jgi:alpha-mannosidase
MPLTHEKLSRALARIEHAAWRSVIPLDGTAYLAESPTPTSLPAAVRDAAWRPLQRGEAWGQRWQTVWLRQRLTMPTALAGQPLALHLNWRRDANQWSPDLIETQVYLGDVLLAGLDGEHRLALLPPDATGRELFLQAHLSETQAFGGLELVQIDRPTEQLAHTLRVALELLREIPSETLAATRVLERLNRAYTMLDLREGVTSERFYASVPLALAYLEAELYVGLDGGARPRIVVTGHAHIDVAWLWPLWRTRQKTAHTFSTMLHLMDQYPEFHFTASTPQLYAFIKEDNPELYARIKARIAEGRWEATGGMWVESDCNVPSGESLVRQFLLGTRFFAEEFGIRDRTLWLPDVFGYSAALPQILSQCGITTFMTTKISWSQFNRMPYDTFRWRGIDGSEVLTHFVTTPERGSRYYTYNGKLTPYELTRSWSEYRQQNINDELLHLVGYGDGGGGTTAAQIEAARRLANAPGMPQVQFGSATAYFERLHARVDADPRLPTWVGELYLEYHRGTYTSQAWIKQANRRAEQRFHEVEFLDALASSMTPHQTQRERLNVGWRLILLNQFHDILPGSSIDLVYNDARAQYAEIARIAEEVEISALASLGRGDERTLGVLNTLGWARTDPMLVAPEFAADLGSLDLPQQPIEDFDGTQALLLGGLTAPAYSLQPLSARSDVSVAVALQSSTTQLENQFYRINLARNGEIASLFDKGVGRELALVGQTLNQLIAFEDRPLNYDAWDIDIFFEEKAYPVDDLQRIAVIEDGPLRAGVEIERRFLSSRIRQRLLIYRDSPRIDFATEIDWHEHQILLKAAFPLDLDGARASYEIQFGAVERPTHRNTSWDVARFETCAQRWADLSEANYGVTLLNDSKYGYDIHDKVMRLTLIKSGVWPDPQADQGLHRFSYALLPHAGDWRSSEVTRRAAELNAPLRLLPVTSDAPHGSFVSCDAANIVIDTVKTAEDGDGLIVRLYEAHGARVSTTLQFARPLRRVIRCSMLEEAQDDVPVSDPQRLTLILRPFQIVSLRIHM